MARPNVMAIEVDTCGEAKMLAAARRLTVTVMHKDKRHPGQ